MNAIRSARLIAGPALFAALLTACTTGPGVSVAPTGSPAMSESRSPAFHPTPSPSAEPTEAAIALKVYFLMNDPRAIQSLVPVQRSVPPTEDLAAATIRELLAGPTADERSGRYPERHGQLPTFSTAVPPDTKLLGIDIQDGIATVDLSADFGSGDETTVLRQAQVVYTLTQFSTVDGVKFRVDGAPMDAIEGHEGTVSAGPATRNLYFDQRRSVFVDEPAWVANVADAVLVRGETTSDADIRIALIDGATDAILAEQAVHASCPCMAPAPWGQFEARLPMPAGPRPSDLRLRIWEPPFSEGGPATVVDYAIGSEIAATASPGSPAPEPTADLTPFNCNLPASLPATVDRAQILDVRVGSHGAGPSGYDRMVFEFKGPGIPKVTLRAGTPPFTQDPSGLPLPVRGSSFLVLVLHGATGITPEGTITYTGPTDFTPGLPALTEFRQAGDFEAVSEWVAGLAGPSCHRLFVLQNPTRLVIDVQHPQG